MGNLGDFDANTVEPQTSFEQLPPGEYPVIIVASEIKPNKAQTGSYLELTFQVVEGQHKGQTIRDYLNLQNPSAIAVKIARARLSTICRAVNVMKPTDSRSLHGIPLIISVKEKKRSDNGETRTAVAGYKSRKVEQSGDIPPWQR